MNLSLNNIKKILDENDLDCDVVKISDEDFDTRLLVFLNLDNKDRPRSLEITLLNQDLLPENFCNLQFMVILPICSEDHTVADTARAISFINRNIALPGFEFDEIEGHILYRYVVLTDTTTTINENYILGIIGNIMSSLDIFGDTIDKITSGEKTFNEMLEEALNIVEE